MSKKLDGITRALERAKHLRKWGKRAFWKRHRAASKRLKDGD